VFLDVIQVCEPEENVSSTFCKYGEQKCNITGTYINMHYCV